MSVSAHTLPEKRERFALLALAVAPILALSLVYYVGKIGFATAGFMAVLAGSVGVVLFTRPLLGVYFLAFYIFSGLGSLLPVPFAVPLTALVFGAALLGFLHGDDNRLRDPVFWWSLGFFAIFGFQSMLVAHHIDLSLLRVLAYVKVFLLVFLIVQFVRTPEHLRTLANAVFLGAVGTILLGVVAYKFGFIEHEHVRFIGTGNVVRFGGIHPGPNESAAYMCAAIPLGFFFIRHAHNAWMRVLYGLGVIILAVGVFSTFSRGAFLPMAVIVLAVLLREFRSPRAYAGFALVLTLTILLAPRHYWDRVFALTEIASNFTKEWSLLMRWRSMQAAWQLFTENPFTGIGMANFVERGATHVWIRIVVHNSFLEVLVGTGIFGLLTFVCMLWSGMRHSIRGARDRWHTAPDWMQSLAFYFAVSLAAAATSALFLSLSYRYLLWIPVAAGLIVGNLRREDDDARHARHASS